jgi:DNA-binding response OmpR family regulator
MYTILIVEDNEALRSLIRVVLEKAFTGSTVQTAASGSAFRRLLQTQQPDVMLLDVMLPDTDGMVLYQELRQEARLSQVPVLFVTATPQLVQREGLQGSHGCLAKPFALDTLVDRVRAMLTARLQPATFTA